MFRQCLILTVTALAGCVSSPDPAPVPDTPAYPFVGTWDCEVETFTFTATTYNNGSETLPIENVVARDPSYALSFANGYAVALDMDGADRMQWLSGETGDTFQCKRL
jgi:hypothetical protein